MKQRITIEQLNELSEEGKEKLRKWWKPREYDLVAWHDGHHKEDGSNWSIEIIGRPDLAGVKSHEMTPLLSIGQMIEFLREKDEGQMPCGGWLDSISIDIEFEGEFCDILWQAVKEVLEG